MPGCKQQQEVLISEGCDRAGCCRVYANCVSIAPAVRSGAEIYQSLREAAAGGAVISQRAPLAAAIFGLTDAGPWLVDDTGSGVIHIFESELEALAAGFKVI